MLSGFRRPKRVAVFISGGGSTLQALLEMHHQLNVTLVVSSKRTALGALKAKRFGKTVIYLDKLIDYARLSEVLTENNIEMIVLAGFMKILPESFVQAWADRLINIHPSLLPLFPGLNSAEKSWTAGSDMGVTLHKVVAEVDSGDVILQRKALSTPKNFSFDEAGLFLRRTEQHVLRELAIGGYS